MYEDEEGVLEGPWTFLLGASQHAWDDSAIFIVDIAAVLHMSAHLDK